MTPTNNITNEEQQDIVSIILSCIIPPLGVALEVGFTKHFWINVILTLFGYVPGVIHAVYIIAKR